MKSLIIIWALVFFTGVGTAVYVASTFNKLAAQNLQPYQLQVPGGLDLGNTICLQNCQPIQVQPAEGL